jgi:hypothetical protein
MIRFFIPDPDPDFYPSRISDPGAKKAPDPIPDPDPQHWQAGTVPQPARRTIERVVLWMRIAFNADPDPVFYLSVDLGPDPGSQTNADPCRSGSWSDYCLLP